MGNLDMEKLKQEMNLVDLSNIEGCEPIALRSYFENKDDTFDFTGYKAEKLTPEIIKLFKENDYRCTFSEEVQEILDSSMEKFESNNTQKSFMNLSELEGCEPVLLEEHFKNKDVKFNFKGYKAKNLTAEIIKLFKENDYRCAFSEEVQKILDDSNE